MTEISTQTNELEQLENTIQSQLNIVREMKQIKQEVINSEQRMIKLVEKVSKEITINYEEQKQIQSVVSTQANAFAEEHLNNLGGNFSNNLFKAWKGLFIRKIYSKLKTRLNVVRYTAVRREEFETTMMFLENLTLGAFTLRDLQPSPAILNVMELEQKGA